MIVVLSLLRESITSLPLQYMMTMLGGLPVQAGEVKPRIHGVLGKKSAQANFFPS